MTHCKKIDELLLVHDYRMSRKIASERDGDLVKLQRDSDCKEKA